MTTSGSLVVLLDPLRADLEVVQDALRRFTADVTIASRSTQEEVRAGLRQLRDDVKIAEAELDAALADDRGAYLAAGRALVDGWRARLDSLRVRSSLARMETRDDVQGALSTVDQALAAADRYLSDAASDARSTLEAVRAGAAQSFASLVAAGRAAVDVVERRTGRGDS